MAAVSGVADSVDWFTIVQSTGIIVSILFAAHSINAQRKAQRLSNNLIITEYHREIWKLAIENEKIREVLEVSFDPDRMTFDQEQFLSFLFLHAGCAYELLKSDSVVDIEGLRRDIREFMFLPGPKVFWRKNKKFYNRGFVEFLEKSAA